jgi:predicted ester cyclase
MEASMRDERVRIVESYLDGLRNKDLSKVAFASDVTFEGPLSPKLTGDRAVVEFLTGLFPAIKDVRVKQHIVEGEYVATIFEFDTTFGVIPIFDCFRVSNGKLTQIRPFYDPRPITNPQES